MTLLAVTAVLALAGCGGQRREVERLLEHADRRRLDASGLQRRRRRDRSSSAADQSALKFDKSSAHRQGRQGHARRSPTRPSVPHAVAIKGNGVDVDGKTVGNGETSTASADLKPGTYKFYCPVPGHEAAGHEGHAHRQLSRAGTARARKSKIRSRSRRTSTRCARDPSGPNGSA